MPESQAIGRSDDMPIMLPICQAATTSKHWPLTTSQPPHKLSRVPPPDLGSHAVLRFHPVPSYTGISKIGGGQLLQRTLYSHTTLADTIVQHITRE